MPIYVGYSQKRRTVKLLGSGRDQIHLCDNGDIVLNAEINDYTNLKNHIFEWEQILGPEIDLIKHDDFSSSFPFSDNFDKRFRFYIDKGTPQEQFDDVDIFYTPTSIQSKSNANFNIVKNISLTVPNLIEESVLFFNSEDTTFSSNLEVQPATKLNFSGLTNRYNPATITRYVVKTSGINTHNPEDIFLDFDINSIPNELILPRGIYTFCVYYEQNGIKKSNTSSLYVSNPDDVENYHAVNTQHGTTSYNSKINYLSRFSISNKLLLSTHSIKSSYNHKLRNITRINPIFINSDSNPELEDSFSVHSLFNSRIVSIERVDPSNIGNT